MIFVKVIKNVFDNLKYDLRNTKYEVERGENGKKRKEFVDLFYIFEKIIFRCFTYKIFISNSNKNDIK